MFFVLVAEMFVICVFESLTNFRLKEREIDGSDAQNCVWTTHTKSILCMLLIQ